MSAEAPNAGNTSGPKGPRLVIGLTGGIGSGKSTVAKLFARLGAPVIDADAIAHELVSPGEPALRAIVAAFGRDVLTPEGTLDRRRLRERAFRDPALRERLETILHPLIRREMRRRVQALDAPYCVLCIPLLLETGRTDQMDRILVVDTPPTLQIERTQARDGSSRETVERIMRAQVDPRERLAAADDVIDNSGTLAQLEAQVESLHRRYLDMATGHLPLDEDS